MIIIAKPNVSSYELRWPHDVFAWELELVSRSPRWEELVPALLADAFRGSAAGDDFAAVVAGPNVWNPTPTTRTTARVWVNELAAHVHDLPRSAGLRPYYPQRSGYASGPQLTSEALRRNFIGYVDDLVSRGYLDEETSFPRRCVDDQDRREVDPADVLSARLGLSVSWPLKPEDWDDDTFYGLIEVFHDLVARPRRRYRHDYASCGWHYHDFAADTGQAIYRDHVNGLLDAAELPLRLAEDGEDVGRLVTRPNDGRNELVEAVLTAPPGTARDRVTHAVSLFRQRDASRDDKRSACVDLAAVLEERRRLLHDHMFSTDEDALFILANKFDLRHRNAKQHADYDEYYLEWIFWWYLATIELANRLLARDAGTP